MFTRLIVSGYTSFNAVVKAEMFPAAIPATGVVVRDTRGASLIGAEIPSLAGPSPA